MFIYYFCEIIILSKILHHSFARTHSNSILSSVGGTNGEGESKEGCFSVSWELAACNDWELPEMKKMIVWKAEEEKEKWNHCEKENKKHEEIREKLALSRYLLLSSPNLFSCSEWLARKNCLVGRSSVRIRLSCSFTCGATVLIEAGCSCMPKLINNKLGVLW